MVGGAESCSANYNAAYFWIQVLHTPLDWDGKDTRELGQIVAKNIAKQRDWIGKLVTTVHPLCERIQLRMLPQQKMPLKSSYRVWKMCCPWGQRVFSWSLLQSTVSPTTVTG